MVPPAQLPKVPDTRRPVGSAAVLTRSLPAAGPVRVKGVLGGDPPVRGAAPDVAPRLAVGLRRSSSTTLKPLRCHGDLERCALLSLSRWSAGT